jgi:hypothetical protein
MSLMEHVILLDMKADSFSIAVFSTFWKDRVVISDIMNYASDKDLIPSLLKYF